MSLLNKYCETLEDLRKTYKIDTNKYLDIFSKIEPYIDDVYDMPSMNYTIIENGKIITKCSRVLNIEFFSQNEMIEYIKKEWFENYTILFLATDKVIRVHSINHSENLFNNDIKNRKKSKLRDIKINDLLY
jgi:hypothetical protein